MQQLAYETLSVDKANNWFVSGARTPDFFKVLNIPARGYHAVAYTYIFERSSADDQYHLAGTVTLEARANYLLGSGRGLFGSLRRYIGSARANIGSPRSGIGSGGSGLDSLRSVKQSARVHMGLRRSEKEFSASRRSALKAWRDRADPRSNLADPTKDLTDATSNLAETKRYDPTYQSILEALA